MTSPPEIRIQILSDLHLESPVAYDLFEIIPEAPYLALIGDIGHVEDKGLFTFLKQQLQQFRTVLFLFGNHEPYESSFPSAKAKMRDFEESIKKERQAGKSTLGTFVFLDQTRFDLSPRITILGCTLFSRIRPEQSDHVSFGLNDFHRIKDWTVEQHTDAHTADLAWLNERVSTIAETEPERRIVILTHYSPTLDFRSVDPAHTSSRISSGFMTDLSEEGCCKNAAITAWAFGHTHYNCDFSTDLTGMRLLTNQRGYYFSQAKGFEPGKVLVLTSL